MTKYALMMSKRYSPAYDPKTGDFIDDIKVVHVKTMDGRERKWKVGKTILENDEMWQTFLMENIVPFVEEWDKGLITL